MKKFDWVAFDSARVQRKAEILAIWFVQKSFGSKTGINVVDRGSCGDTDFVVHDHGTLVGIGEVKGDFSPIIQKRRADFEKYGAYCLPLDPGLGVWTASLLPNADVEKLVSDVPDLIKDLVVAGGSSIETSATWHYGLDSLAARATVLGIDSLFAVHGSSDFVHFVSDRFGGSIAENGALVSAWLNDVIAKHANKAAIVKVSKSDLPQRHIFIWLAANSPSPVRLSAAFHPDVAPSDDPNIPAWITHLWVGIPRNFTKSQYLWLYRPELGWSVLQFDGLFRPREKSIFRAFARILCKIGPMLCKFKCFSRERAKST